MKTTQKFLLILSILSFSFSQARSRRTSISSLRVGESKIVRGYKKITAEPSSLVHISSDEDEHEITGMNTGMVVLKFYDEDGKKIREKALQIRPERQEPEVNVSFGFGVGAYPRRRYYYSTDPFYDPLYGWWATPHIGYWSGHHRHRRHHH